jgi:hypothetical protein
MALVPYSHSGQRSVGIASWNGVLAGNSIALTKIHMPSKWIGKVEDELKSCGYDFLAQVDEHLLNKGLSAAFYTGMLKASGVYSFVQGIPPELLAFTQVRYRIRLRNEPYIDFLEKDKVGIRLSVEVILLVLTDVQVEIDVDCAASAKVTFDIESGKISYQLEDTDVYDVVINDRYRFYKNALDRLDEVLRILIRNYLSNDVKEISLPISFHEIVLPTLPDTQGSRLALQKVDVEILNQRLLVVGVDFFDHTGGSLDGIQDMIGQAEMMVALRADALRQIAKFWWDHTELEKSKTFQGRFPVSIRKKLAKVQDIFIRAVTLGFLEPETQVLKADLVYDGKVSMVELPTIDFLSGDQAQIHNLKLNVVLHGRLDTETRRILQLDSSGFIPDTITPWQDDIKISDKSKSESLFDTTENLMVEVEVARCTVSIDEQNRLVLKVCEADLQLDLGSQWYDHLTERVANALLDFLEKTVVSRIPPIVISPSLLLSNIKVSGYTFGIGLREIELEPDEVSLWSSLKVNELTEGAIAYPLYIGNKKSMKLHRFDCPVVEDIDFSHRIGYHSVSEAIKDGLKPCGDCLRGYPKQDD